MKQTIRYQFHGEYKKSLHGHEMNNKFYKLIWLLTRPFILKINYMISWNTAGKLQISAVPRCTFVKFLCTHLLPGQMFELFYKTTGGQIATKYIQYQVVTADLQDLTNLESKWLWRKPDLPLTEINEATGQTIFILSQHPQLLQLVNDAQPIIENMSNTEESKNISWKLHNILSFSQCFGSEIAASTFIYRYYFVTNNRRQGSLCQLN